MFKKIGIIGAGVMGEVFIVRLLAAGIKPQNIIATAPDRKRLEVLCKKFKIGVSQNNSDALADSDLIIIAVKPQQALAALGNLSKPKDRQIFLSIMAGVDMKTIAKLTRAKKIARVMPNTPAQIGLGMSVWTAVGLSAKEKRLVKIILRLLGEQLEVKNDDIVDKATAVSGSGPAYVFDFATHLIAAARALGFNEKQAKQLVSQTIIGAGNLLAQSRQDAGRLRQNVASKGGTTEAALEVIDKNNLQKVYRLAIKSAYARARRLRRSLTK